MPVQENQAMPWSTHDPACSNCRVRKIRCDRHRPQCTNCKRDGTHCEFSDHGKRVNHIKLLANNVGGIENRLINIERELASLIHKGSKRRSTCANLDMASISTSNEEQSIEGSFSLPADRHVVQCQFDSSYHYHGPCTLFSLCDEFRARVTDEQTTKTSGGSKNAHENFHIKCKDKINGLLQAMCSSIATEAPVESTCDSPWIVLPPRPFLVISCTSLFQQDDPVMDIFCQSTFWQNVDRIYSKSLPVPDKPWALCFTIIILLVLGAEQPETKRSDPVMGSQFITPLVSTVRYALTCPNMLMTPKLINVQVLALLSIAAQQHLQPSFAEALLAQACLLARRMGLHQQQASRGQITSGEDVESAKVFRSLFLRDKTLSLYRGMNCLLPSFDCSFLFELEERFATGAMTARLQLARLQEEIYRTLYSHESPRLSMSQQKSNLSRIEQDLQDWAEAHRAEFSKAGSLLDLKMEFYACRIIALRSSSDPKHMKQVVQDARVSCQLLCMPGESIEGDVLARQEPVQKGPKRKNSSREPLIANESKHSELRIRGLAETFSSAAFFALAKNIVWTVVDDDTQTDVKLMRTVCHYFQQLGQKLQPISYTRKVSQIFDNLFTAVQMLKPDVFQCQQQPYVEEQSHIDHSLIHESPPVSAIDHSMADMFSDLASGGPCPSLTFSGINLALSSSSSIDMSEFNPLGSLDFHARSPDRDAAQTSLSLSREHSCKRQDLMLSQTMDDDFFSHHLFPLFPDMNTTNISDNEIQNPSSAWF